MRWLTAAVLLWGGVAAPASRAADWPGFRGPHRDGISAETGLLESWPEDGPPVLWRAELGEGYSGISVVGGRLYTLYAADGEERVVCLATGDGRELWRYRIGERWKDMMGNGPRSTPTLVDGVVYALGAYGNLAALDATSGRELWARDLRQAVGGRPPAWGVSTSPLVEGELVIVDAGGRSGHSIVALDRRNGELVWHVESDKAGYAAPLALAVEGSRQVVVFTGTQVVGVDPADGSVLWKKAWRTDFDVNAATPVFVPPNRLFVSSGYSTGGALFELQPADGRMRVRRVWQSPQMRNQFSSSIYHQGHIYGFDNGTLKCLDAATGEERWAVREGFGHGSLILADGHFYVMGDRGQLALVEATPEGYRESSSYRALNGKCWTAPTLAGGRLYIRNENELLALNVRRPTS